MILHIAMIFILGIPVLSWGKNDPKACTNPRSYSPIVTKSICDSKNLQRLESKVFHKIKKLQKSTPKKQELFFKKITKFLKIELNHCNHLHSSHGTNEKMITCLQTTLRRYQSALTLAEGKGAAKMSAISQNIKFMDVPFLLKWGVNLNKQSVRVWGSLNLAGSTTTAGSKKLGWLNEASGPQKVQVQFKSLSASQIQFLKKNQPLSHHKGQVLLKKGKPTLLLDTFLGQSLD